MIKRAFGWLLFLWMLACLYGVFFDPNMDMNIAQPAKLWVKPGTAAFIAALAGIGLMMGLGKNTKTGPPETPASDS